MAKGKKGKKKKGVLYRVVNFRINLSLEQISVLQRISSLLVTVWNKAHEVRQEIFDTHMRPIYEAIKEAEKAGDEELARYNKYWLKVEFKKNPLPTLFDQINALTLRRKKDPEFASVLRNWQEETLDTLHGSFRSFLKLRREGDYDARPPQKRDENLFSEIPGRSGFKISDGKISLSGGKVARDVELVFPIPKHQQRKLQKAIKVKKFTLYRDERDLSKPGRFWISLAYEIPMPKTEEFTPEKAVFVALGSASIGVVSPKGEMVIKLWRPDRHWIPKIEAVQKRMKECAKGSSQWKRLNQAKRQMQTRMSRQQKQNRREVAQKLLKLGKHFVVTDLVVRSKSGKLADGTKPERGGPLGLNWSAQNTGSIAYLVLWLEEKAKEKGGTVQRHKLPEISAGRSNDQLDKISVAKILRDSFLSSSRKSAG